MSASKESVPVSRRMSASVTSAGRRWIVPWTAAAITTARANTAYMSVTSVLIGRPVHHVTSAGLEATAVLQRLLSVCLSHFHFVLVVLWRILKIHCSTNFVTIMDNWIHLGL